MLRRSREHLVLRNVKEVSVTSALKQMKQVTKAVLPVTTQIAQAVNGAIAESPLDHFKLLVHRLRLEACHPPCSLQTQKSGLRQCTATVLGA